MVRLGASLIRRWPEGWLGGLHIFTGRKQKPKLFKCFLRRNFVQQLIEVNRIMVATPSKFCKDKNKVGNVSVSLDDNTNII